MLNSSVFIGRLVRDVEPKYTEGGKCYAHFRFAVDRNKQETDFFDGLAWDKTAETLGNYGTKGRLLALLGRMQSRTYDGKAGKMEKVEFVAERVRFLDRSESPAPPADDPFAEEISHG